MIYEVNNYYRYISDEELIIDLKSVGYNLQKDVVSKAEYNANGKYSASTIEKRFFSWSNACLLAGLNKFNNHIKNRKLSEKEIVDDLKNVSYQIKSEKLTAREYSKFGKFNISSITNYFGSWNSALEHAGLKITLNRNFCDEELFAEIERLWILLGKQPTTSDLKSGISKYSLQSYSRRFGGWRNTLISFLAYIENEDNQDKVANEQIYEEIYSIDKYLNINNNFENTIFYKHNTSRNINLRLRYKVMRRDNFKCCICGASPAKNPSVELHIDHIVPWAKGGESVIENLQTLCSDCNFGKSDLQ